MIDLPASFRAAIVAEPDDDLPRLIAADWWEEHGEVTRATFIRASVEYASALRPAACECWTLSIGMTCGQCWAEQDRLHRLFSTANERFDEAKSEWLKLDLPGLERAGRFGPNSASYNRGFCDSLRVDVLTWFRLADALTSASPIRKVIFAEPSNFWRDRRLKAGRALGYRGVGADAVFEAMNVDGGNLAPELRRRWPRITFVFRLGRRPSRISAENAAV